METVRVIRNLFFQEVGSRRVYRILFCALVIALIWTFADWRSGNYNPMLLDDAICLVLGVIAERLLSWGKHPVEEKEIRTTQKTGLKDL